MTIIFRARSRLFKRIRSDLHRPHAFARERVGFITCSAGRLSNGGLVLLATEYEPIADEDYLDDPDVGALMGPKAIRRALQRAYNLGKGDISMFHVHLHRHSGPPEFSKIDRDECARFVPDFFNVAPNMPHGAIVLSLDNACGYCWASEYSSIAPIDRFASVGAPLELLWRTK